MPVLKNTNPLGQVDLPLINRQGEPFGETGRGCLEPDEEFEVTDEQALNLLAQIGNYGPVDDAAKGIHTGLFPPEEVEAPAEPEAHVDDDTNGEAN